MYPRYPGNDRRRFQRLKINLTVWFKIDSPYEVRDITSDREIEATTLDLCEGGVSLLTEYNIPSGTILRVTIFLFRTDQQGVVDYSQPVELFGEVRYNRFEPAEHRHRLGLCFKEIAALEQNKIASFVGETRI
jgi:c-di-GMP-binding flagellar brake protein YcgR